MRTRSLIPFSLLIAILLNACTTGIQQGDVLTSAEATILPPNKISETSSQTTVSKLRGEDPQLEGSFPIADEKTRELMFSLKDGSLDEAQDATRTILEAHDTRFIAVFIEMLRAGQIGIAQGAGYQNHIEALETLSGQNLGDDWPAWVEWYGGTDLIPPPGFVGWKGELMGLIDPEFAGFLRDEFPVKIRAEEIVWGGVRVDGIPALDNATMILASAANYLEPEEPVFGISINGDHRAYPLRILDWHEMANDVVGGVPVSLAYCTLCGAGIAFDGRVSNGETYTFGSSGFLFRSNKLMYDRQTRTLWNQLTGEPVLGELAGTGIQLKLLPIVLTSWEDWQNQHPDTSVLSINTGYDRIYVPGAAYGDYFSYQETMFPVWQRSNLLDTKARVYAMRIDGIPKAYPVEILVEKKVLNDTIGETQIVLTATRNDVTVQGQNLRIGKVTYNSGGEVRAFYRAGEIFHPSSKPGFVIDSSGESWEITENGLISPDGKVAPRANGHLAYWFGWFTFFPRTQVYGYAEN